ncbi:MAG: hypothetical protein ACYDHY_06530 [Acidiferrobacterales bacterium]
MKKVLITHAGKDTLVWDISTAELRDRALIELFGLRHRAGLYQSLPADQFQFFNMAQRDNARYAEALLLFRKDLPGEGFEEVLVTPGRVSTSTVKATRTVRVECPEALQEAAA